MYFCKLKDDEGKVEECMPDTWLKSEPNCKEPYKRWDAGVRDERRTHGFIVSSCGTRWCLNGVEARARSRRLGTGTDVKESTAGRG